MFTYRKLTIGQTVGIARHLIEQENKRALRALLDDFYGTAAYLVDIEVAHGK